MLGEWLFHQSHLPLYRHPFGAVACCAPVKLSIGVKDDAAVDKVYLRTWRDGLGEELWPMKQEPMDGGYTIYSHQFAAPAEPGIIWYYFIVHSNGAIYYYGNNPKEQGGVGAISPSPPPSYQITVYRTDAATPDWFKNAVVYQIFVDRFYSGNPQRTVAKAKPGSLIHAHWQDDPVYVRERETGRILAYDFFGGDLAGVIAKLPYLRELGVSALYLNPVFESISNHKYDTADYKNIDAMFGDNEIFRELCDKATRLGMAVILDGVFSHTGSDSIYFNKEGHYPDAGAYQSRQSPYYSWYRFSKFPDEYESWWGVDALPNVNEMDQSYRDYIIHAEDSVIRHWQKLGAKGWRLDVADELPDVFIKELRQVLKAADEDSVLIGEVWEDASRKVSYSELRSYLLGDELDSPTNYPFRLIALDFLLGRADAGATKAALLSLAENYPLQNFYAALNLVGSHDVPRILTLLGGHVAREDLPYSLQLKLKLTPEERQLAAARLRLLSLWQMTFPGVPHIYYGDEAGLEGYTDPLNRRTFPWGLEDQSLQAWYKKVIGLRNEYAFLRTGHWQPLECGGDVFSYARFTEQGCDAFGKHTGDNFAVILLNRSSGETFAEVDVGGWRRGMLFDALNGELEVPVGNGKLGLKLKPFEGKVLLAQPTGIKGKCGILLHPTSLPSEHGIGGLGKEAYEFLDFLTAAKQSYWQILPLNPVGFGYSPYQSVSAQAGETLLIDIDGLVAEGLLTWDEVESARSRHGIGELPPNKVLFDAVKGYKQQLFRLAYDNFAAGDRDGDYHDFTDDNKYWLSDYALYMALSEHFGHAAWNIWPEDIAFRQPAAMEKYQALLGAEIDYHCFLQYIFRRQWASLRQHAKEKGVAIIGDMPIFVAYHSCDVWANRELFELDAQSRPTVVAGVPPDYFSETGQLWGNPLYCWGEMAKNDYAWWRQRISSMLGLADLIRIDHFRGFEAYWAVPAYEKTAENGRWVKGPGQRFFSVLEHCFGALPVIAEDLGIITEDVTALRHKFGLPGMKVLQFCFPEGNSETQPLECGRDAFVYTGTHDNNTTLGWYKERLAAGDTHGIDQYLPQPEKGAQEVPWQLIEIAYQSKAIAAIIPLQDILILDETNRMNTPGTVGGNWQWRCLPGALTRQLAQKLADLAEKYHRG